jgi:hypothetical protein
MPETSLPIIAEGVPAGLCYTNMSDDIPVIASFLRAIFTGDEINTGSSTPAPEDRGKPWYRTNADGTDDGWWTFYSGFWIQKHPMFSGFIGFAPIGTALTDIDTLDGGEAGAITSITGPFWQVVSELNAKSPIGPGTLPSGTIINPGDTIGEESHVQTADELRSHRHDIPYSGQGSLSGDGAHILNGTPVHTGDHFTSDTGGDPPTGMNVIHPVYALYAIKRTSRLYRRRVA